MNTEHPVPDIWTDLDFFASQAIGSFLLSMLPQDKTSPLSNSTTPEVLIQCVDSFIDLYSDEESSYDVLVFRSKGFLARLESSVPGVRAAVSVHLDQLVDGTLS